MTRSGAPRTCCSVSTPARSREMYIRSGSTTSRSENTTSSGAANTAPTGWWVKYAVRAPDSVMETVWCFVLGEGVTTCSPSMISCRLPSFGKLRKSSYVNFTDGDCAGFTFSLPPMRGSYHRACPVEPQAHVAARSVPQRIVFVYGADM